MTSRTKALALTAALGVAIIGPALAFAHGSSDGGTPDGSQAAHIQERFAAMDTDKDGKVTPAELAAHRTARFAERDTNGDGKLSLAEIDAAHAKHRQERIARMIAWNDTDGDGMLSAGELPHRGAGRMMKLDRDGDGAVSLEEMQAMKDHGNGGWSGRYRGHHDDKN